MSQPACKLRRVGNCSAPKVQTAAAAEMEQRLAKVQKERDEMDSMWRRPGDASVEKKMDKGYPTHRP